MNSKSRNSVKDNFILRVDADIFRIMTLALREKVQNENLIDAAILRVETAPDLSTSRVFVNGRVREFEALSGLFRNEIAHNMRIKRVPALRFIVDEGDKNTARVEELLRQIKGEK